MRGGERRHAENMHVVLDRLARGFRRRRKQRPDIDVEAEIGKGRRDHLLPAVVAVLADLGDQMRGLRPSAASNASTATRTRSTAPVMPTSRL